MTRMWRWALVAIASAGCGAGAPAGPPAAVTAVYDKSTGRLESLVADRDGDGKAEARAQMAGSRVRRVEVDRDADGEADRWETYSTAETSSGTAPEIERAEEADRPGAPINRVEVYERGRLLRVEEDTDRNGRIDKWERYELGRLAAVELDLAGRGRPTERWVYGADGALFTRESLGPSGEVLPERPRVRTR